METENKSVKQGLKQGLIIMGVMLLVVLVAMLVIPRGELLQPKPRPTNPPAPTGPTLPPNPYDGQLVDHLTEETGKAVLGIDVSYYQKEIDWEAVASSGIEFAMIRLGFRGYTDGILHPDEKVAENLAGAKAAGLKIGAYFFSQAVNVQEAKAEAAYALELLDGITLDLPLAFDWENIDQPARTDTVNKETLTECAIAFCEAVKAAGREPMIYFNRTQAMDMLELDRLTDYEWWFAQYQTVMDFPYRVGMWQYTQTGSVDGITGAVDINVKFVD
jgi:GH25 family lysozyme M1 (1,4-beta-N-acetylmuramidase)